MTFPVSFRSFLKVCFPDVSEAIPVLFQIPLKLIFLHSSFLFSVHEALLAKWLFISAYDQI